MVEALVVWLHVQHAYLPRLHTVADLTTGHANDNAIDSLAEAAVRACEHTSVDLQQAPSSRSPDKVVYQYIYIYAFVLYVFTGSL